MFGSALAAEGIFAFFLESGFLAVLVFGWDKVSPRVHFGATCLVALDAVFSSVWIVAANSWMQTPAGFHIVGDGLAARAEITEFWAMVFNPSSLHRLGHVLIGCYIQGAFFVMSIAAFYLIRDRHVEFAQKSFTLALGLATVMGLAALVSGDLQARKVAATQPAKFAALEKLYATTDGPTPLTVAGVTIPGGLSFLVHGNFQEPVTGLDQFPREDWPPVTLTSLAFRSMVALGLMMIGLTALAWVFYKRGTLFTNRALLWVFVWAVPLPILANQLGWIAAEVGRQPWIVYGLLRTSDALLKAVRAEQVLGSIIMFTVIYALLLLVWLYILDHKIKQGPDEVTPAAATTAAGLLDAAARRAQLTKEDR